MALARALRRGFWRLTLLFWVAGAIGLVWWEGEPLFSPRTNVCVEAESPVYSECAIAPDPARSGITDRLLGALRDPPLELDPTRAVPRWTTTRYRAALHTLAVRQATWAALVWVPFYLLVWAFAGFRSDDARPS